MKRVAIVNLKQTAIQMHIAKEQWLDAKWNLKGKSGSAWSKAMQEIKRTKKNYKNMANWLALGLYGSEAKFIQ